MKQKNDETDNKVYVRYMIVKVISYLNPRKASTKNDLEQQFNSYGCLDEQFQIECISKWNKEEIKEE